MIGHANPTAAATDPVVVIGEPQNAGPVVAALIAIEKRSWEANIRGDAAFFETLLIDDALAVSERGVANKAIIVETIRQNRNPYSNVTIENPRAVILADSSAYVTYTVHVVAQSGSFSAFTTTVYTMVSGTWKAALFQLSAKPARQ